MANKPTNPKILIGLSLVAVIAFYRACSTPSSPSDAAVPTASAPEQVASAPVAVVPSFTRPEVVAARKKYTVQVIDFDASQEFGTSFPYSDRVRVRVTNGSDIALPWLTVITRRYNRQGQMVGSSRNPPLPVKDLLPGETAELEFFPKGHLPNVTRITVEVEHLMAPEDEQFIKELENTGS